MLTDGTYKPGEHEIVVHTNCLLPMPHGEACRDDQPAQSEHDGRNNEGCVSLAPDLAHLAFGLRAGVVTN
ncbi:hypothetical protein CMQ_281 [Grosmannia clavigera kw1407]|uniref:Uncharacterized protein n=1 Tax=Grosmannia clavigera (strain kw1407 / UAMH 11150) TaxID=655863 RepID=F0XQX8_GROCL|nr:uncharacterized protein CMQ_281 [Grosmannia clavigera kw1407]EFW99963.1 hypothetical protein CMQ_281 [Grosmannia clavigera kw1407]